MWKLRKSAGTLLLLKFRESNVFTMKLLKSWFDEIFFWWGQLTKLRKFIRSLQLQFLWKIPWNYGFYHLRDQMFSRIFVNPIHLQHKLVSRKEYRSNNWIANWHINLGFKPTYLISSHFCVVLRTISLTLPISYYSRVL